MPAADEAGLVVVGAEVGGAGVRHFDRDERNARVAVLRRDDRRDVLVGLELDDEIDFLAHQDVGVALRDLGVVAVVDADELDALRRRGALEAGRDLLRELVVGALRRVAEPERALLERAQVRAIEVLADLFEHAAPLQRVEQPERHALGQPAAGRDLAQRQGFARGAERRQQLRGVHDRLHQIRIAAGRCRVACSARFPVLLSATVSSAEYGRYVSQSATRSARRTRARPCCHA